MLVCGFLGELDFKIVMSGTHKDNSLFRKMNSLTFRSVINLAGQTDLKQLMALMNRADIVISADSGPLHMANAVGSNVIGLYGPTRPEITGPRGNGKAFVLQHNVGCNQEPCYYLQCPDNICMKSITVDDVNEIIKQIRN